ncbi:unnamed protein product [Schistosoma margrebowiei]|uniref:Uncharacterized protein n=1 Tax=Schistosoma margrebowiei TaxID=48269 RepID=A0AA84ZFZ3_9TREM|nr:unnamed protein product [Schistosoma margrebowiei]
MIYVKCFTLISFTIIIYGTFGQYYKIWSEYPQSILQNEERLTKRPWTLRDPLNCCLDNAKCCRRKRYFGRKLDEDDEDEFGLTRGEHAWKNRVYQIRNRMNPLLIKKFTHERMNKY